VTAARVRNLLLAAITLSIGLLSNAFARESTLRVAFEDRNPGLGNPYGTIVTSGISTLSILFDALTVLGPNGHLDPGLAVSWEPTSATTWKFVLRPDITFSNGEPFTAQAVVSVFDYLRSSASAGNFISGEVTGIKHVEAEDNLTVVFTTTAPDAILPKRLSLIYMVPPKAWSEMGQDNFAQDPSGTGSFVLDSWGQKTGRILMSENLSSWRSSRYVSRLELINVSQQVSRTQALISGQVEIAYNVGFEDIERLEALGYHVIVKPVAFVNALVFSNIRPGPLKDRRVRQALNYAVNKSEITDVLLRGTTTPNGQGAIPSVFGYNPDILPYPYDPVKARALLREAGYEDGLTLAAQVWGAGLPEQEAIYIKVAQDLDQIGVTLRINSVVAPVWLDKWYTGKWGDTDIISGTWNSSSFNDVIRAIENFSCKKPGVVFCAPDLMDLIEESNATFDQTTREKHLQKLLAHMHNIAPTLYLFGQTHIYAIAPILQNITFRHEQLALDLVKLNR